MHGKKKNWWQGWGLDLHDGKQKERTHPLIIHNTDSTFFRSIVVVGNDVQDRSVVAGHSVQCRILLSTQGLRTDFTQDCWIQEHPITFVYVRKERRRRIGFRSGANVWRQAYFVFIKLASLLWMILLRFFSSYLTHLQYLSRTYLRICIIFGFRPRKPLLFVDVVDFG